MNTDAISKEVTLHSLDAEYGAPLVLGDITIGMHAANCSRCAFLTYCAALKLKPTKENAASWIAMMRGRQQGKARIYLDGLRK